MMNCAFTCGTLFLSHNYLQYLTIQPPPQRSLTSSAFCSSTNQGGRFHGLPVRVLSIGGGPGFELLAMERFFRQ